MSPGGGARQIRALPCDRVGRWLLVNDAHVEIDSKTEKNGTNCYVFSMLAPCFILARCPRICWGALRFRRGSGHKKERLMASLYTFRCGARGG